MGAEGLVFHTRCYVNVGMSAHLVPCAVPSQLLAWAPAGPQLRRAQFWRAAEPSMIAPWPQNTARVWSRTEQE